MQSHKAHLLQDGHAVRHDLSVFVLYHGFLQGLQHPYDQKAAAFYDSSPEEKKGKTIGAEAQEICLTCIEDCCFV